MIILRERIVVGIMVAAAIRNYTELWSKRLDLSFPGAVIALAAMEEDERLTLSPLDVVEFDTPNLNLRRLNTLAYCGYAKEEREQGK
jgi:hypothetical protein